jgi:hypothetical protein
MSEKITAESRLLEKIQRIAQQNEVLQLEQEFLTKKLEMSKPKKG